MNDQERAVMQKAQEALEKARDTTHSDTLYAQFEVAITALRAALEQQEPGQGQEPVAWVDEASIAWLAEHPRGIITTRLVKQKSPERQMAMYAEPPRREWQSLSEEEINELSHTMVKGHKSVNWLARAIEAALKEKNNG
jgi:hypothetical protein